jgi:alkylhydroperoxidase family enzyme
MKQRLNPYAVAPELTKLLIDFGTRAWRESSLYSDRERAALAWTDALTRLTETGAPDDVYQAVQKQFTEKEQVMLTLMISVINSFNRMGVGFRVDPDLAVKRQAA